MKKKLLGAILTLGMSAALWAQPVIKVEMPEFADRNLVISLNKGLKNDTVFNAALDSKGSAIVRIPMSETNFSGIATLGVSPQESTDLIINRKDFTVKNTGADFSPVNIQFINSEENTQFLAWKQTRMLHDQRSYLMNQMTGLYTAEDAFYAALTKEKARLEATKPGFSSPPDLDSWYAPQFAQIIDFLSGDLATIARSEDLEVAIAVRSYAMDSLNVEALYTSGLWFNVINGFLGIYQPGAPFNNSFGRDMSMILARTASLPVYEAFAGDLIMICTQFGWENAKDEIVNFILNEQRITNPTNNMLRAAFAAAAIVPGKIAPPISGIERFSDGNNKTLLIFYESDCVACKAAIQTLKEQYDFFVQNNVRIISISADTDENVFKAYSADFPWVDKVVDFKGFHGAGGNFKTYGILATPTMFLLDKNNTIISRFASVNDVIKELKK